jgi:hypothetical protein
VKKINSVHHCHRPTAHRAAAFLGTGRLGLWAQTIFLNHRSTTSSGPVFLNKMMSKRETKPVKFIELGVEIKYFLDEEPKLEPVPEEPEGVNFR